MPEVSDAIWNVLKDKYVHFPSHETEWKAISNEFDEIWNFLQCLGAIDGKHVRIVAPRSSGTLYHNYKGFFSLILLAICDAKYNFTYVTMGEYGSNNDSGVLQNSGLHLVHCQACHTFW